MTARPAALVLAHENPGHVRRLIAALDGLDIFLHCDARAGDRVLAAMVAGPQDVVLTPRVRSTRGTWSVVEAELAGLRIALERSAAEHIIVLSGSCYPLITVSALEDELADWRGLSRLELNQIPRPGWNYRLGADGGRWRFNRRFLRIGRRPILVRGAPIPIGRRPVPGVLALRASSQWKIYAREHARTLLSVLDERPDLVRFWRMAFLPDESCPATMLSSRELVGDVADSLRHDQPWYIDWTGSQGNGHPRWLQNGDFPKLVEARRRPRALPDDPGTRGLDQQKLFARKIGPGGEELVANIDDQLRV